MGFWNNVEKFLVGGRDEPGFLGTGKFKTDVYEVNPNVANIPGYADMQGRLQGEAETAAQGNGIQLNKGQSNQTRAGQMDLAGALTQQANGQGPSLAQGQLRQATDRNIAQALALGASQRGMGAAGGLRAIADQRAQIGQQAASDSSQLALNEQMQARNQLGQVLTGARGQDIAVAGQDAQLASQMTQFYTSQGLSLAQAQQQAAMQLEQLKSNNYNTVQGINSGAYNNAAQNRFGVGKAIAGAAGGGAGAGAAAGGG